jgi:hypothetical protein
MTHERRSGAVKDVMDIMRWTDLPVKHVHPVNILPRTNSNETDGATQNAWDNATAERIREGNEMDIGVENSLRDSYTSPPPYMRN